MDSLGPLGQGLVRPAEIVVREGQGDRGSVTTNTFIADGRGPFWIVATPVPVDTTPPGWKKQS
jgi:hypothetical protein